MKTSETNPSQSSPPTENLPTSRKVIIGIYAWLAVGLIALVYLIFAYNPAGPTLGVAASAARDALYTEFSAGVVLPIAIYGTYVVSRSQRFRAPPGRYIFGQKYSLFSPYNLAAMGIIGALYAAGGVFTAVTNFDIVAAVTAFAAVMFAPIVPLVAIIVGGVLRFALTGISFTPTAAVPGFIIMDASRWVIASWLIFTFVRPRMNKATSYIVWIVMMAIILVQYSIMTLAEYFILNPYSAFVGNVVYMGTWFPTTVISAVVGLIVAEGAYRSFSRRQQRSDAMRQALAAKASKPTQPTQP